MDLYAFMVSKKDNVSQYINKHYGEVPRLRGVRFMKTEPVIKDPEDDEERMFNKYVGQDVIYIHTRCGDCGSSYDDENSNYIYCGGRDWEEAHKDLFLDHVTDEWDRTYCTHYFKAVVDKMYEVIVAEVEKE